MRTLNFTQLSGRLKRWDECDVAIMVLDAEKGITHQDLSIYKMAIKKTSWNCSGLLINGDLIEKETNTAREFEKALKEKTCPL
jgi:GTP-binding protein